MLFCVCTVVCGEQSSFIIIMCSFSMCCFSLLSKPHFFQVLLAPVAYASTQTHGSGFSVIPALPGCIVSVLVCLLLLLPKRIFSTFVIVVCNVEVDSVSIIIILFVSFNDVLLITHIFFLHLLYSASHSIG